MSNDNIPKVTIIIPAYNAEKYIEKCAFSVLNQTLKEIEIIFIDDGSNDGTGNIIEKIAKNRSNVHVIHQNNKGLYKTREIGLKMAKGEYVGWVDADDFVELDMYEILYENAKKNDSELVICNYNWYPEKISTKEKWYREYKGKIDVDFIERNSQPWNKIVKRDLMIKLNIGEYFVPCFDEIYIRILMEAKNPIMVKECLYNYRVGSDTMSSSYVNVEHYKNFVNASKSLRKLMLSVNNDKYWNDYFEYRIIYYYLMTMIVAANSDNKKAYLKVKEELNDLYPKYYNNQHFKSILKKNFGLLKFIAVAKIIPKGYNVARMICKVCL